jgi:putative component of membrane protein insertase Oxa1/YidC/SpoIIIJ protein YidD
MIFPLNLALTSIDFYQKYISPRKGYKCAYGALYNEKSCSSYCKNEIISKGLIKGIKSTFVRFKECKLAAHSIKKKREEMKVKANNSYTNVKNECSSLDTCDKLLLAEAFGEVACCLLSGAS